MLAVPPGTGALRSPIALHPPHPFRGGYSHIRTGRGRFRHKRTGANINNKETE